MLVKEKLIVEKKNWDNITIEKPFLKWVGGKTQIIKDILQEFPIDMDNYYEIFLGGGSILIGILSLQKEGIIKIKKKIYAYDYNKQLIYLYKHIQRTPKKFLNTIIKLINEYYAISGNEINRKPDTLEKGLTSQESYYYWIRKQYNSMNEEENCSLLGSAYFLFLNKICFRGVYRLSKNKKFNVPYGHYSNPSIIEKSHIKNISKLIQHVEFVNLSFEESLKNIKIQDYVFLDPPYVLLNSKSFVSYTSGGFGKEMHDKLFNMLYELKKQNIKWMMTNSSAEYVIKSFDDNKYNVKKILCRRAINSKNPESKVNELIIKSY